MKIMIFGLLFSMTAYAQQQLVELGEQIDAIAGDSAEPVNTIGLFFNPDEVDIQGARVGIKTIAVPASSGPLLIKNARGVIGRVEAVYLIKGRSVTTPKFASFILKLAARKGVGVYTNDLDLRNIAGIRLVEKNGSGYVIKGGEAGL